MKLMARLAKQFVEECEGTIGILSEHYKEGLREGFFAGFEKAREMAAAKAKDKYWNGHDWDASSGVNWIHVLGEEEVE